MGELPLRRQASTRGNALNASRAGLTMRFPNSLLWIDSRAGLTVGATVLAFSGWWSRLYGLPHPLVLGMGIANVVYGSYSFVLERRATRSSAALMLLIVANAAWSVVCFALAVTFAASASALGTGVLVFEGIFVGGLAALEWTHRATLAGTNPG
jgi:hypothetical protein